MRKDMNERLEVKISRRVIIDIAKHLTQSGIQVDNVTGIVVNVVKSVPKVHRKITSPGINFVPLVNPAPLQKVRTMKGALFNVNQGRVACSKDVGETDGMIIPEAVQKVSIFVEPQLDETIAWSS